MDATPTIRPSGLFLGARKLAYCYAKRMAATYAPHGCLESPRFCEVGTPRRIRARLGETLEVVVLFERISVGVDRMQRNIEPTPRQVGGRADTPCDSL